MKLKSSYFSPINKYSNNKKQKKKSHILLKDKLHITKKSSIYWMPILCTDVINTEKINIACIIL